MSTILSSSGPHEPCRRLFLPLHFRVRDSKGGADVMPSLARSHRHRRVDYRSHRLSGAGRNSCQRGNRARRRPHHARSHEPPGGAGNRAGQQPLRWTDRAGPRPQSRPPPGRVVPERGPHHLGVQAPARHPVPQRRALRRRISEVQPRAAHRSRAQAGSSAFTPLTHVEIVDPFTVRVHSKAGWPLLPAVLTTGQAAMLPPRYYREKEMPYLQKNPVGSGPFKFVRWVKDDRIELEANEQYWLGVPRIKRLVFKPIPDDAVRVAALQNGEVDIAVNIPPH